jgi:hypothetical protein
VKTGWGAAKSRSLAIAPFALVISYTASATVAEPNDYSIASIESDLRPMDKIGRLRAGMLCLPKGKLLWRDMAKPTDAVAINILSRRLAALGLTIADVPDPLFSEVAPLTKYRVRVTYESLEVKLCIPGLGISEKHPSGTGRMLVRWETFERSTKTKVAAQSFEVSISLDGRDARNDSSVIRDAL